MREDNRKITFSLEEELLLIIGLLIMARSNGLKLHLNDGFVSHKHRAFCITSDWCGLLVDYCLDSHSDGTHSLQWILL